MVCNFNTNSANISFKDLNKMLFKKCTLKFINFVFHYEFFMFYKVYFLQDILKQNIKLTI